MELWYLIIWLGAVPTTGTSSGLASRMTSIGPFASMEQCTKIAYAIEHAAEPGVIGAGCSVQPISVHR
jgi:hypothetical protein